MKARKMLFFKGGTGVRSLYAGNPHARQRKSSASPPHNQPSLWRQNAICGLGLDDNQQGDIAVRLGTNTPIMLSLPRYRVTIPLRGYGSYAVRIANSREFVVQVVGALLARQLARPAGSTPSIQSVAGDATGRTVDRAATHLLGGADHCLCAAGVRGLSGSEENQCVGIASAYPCDRGARWPDLLRGHYKTFGVELVNFSVESINFDPNDESVLMASRYVG